jgi:glycosyltransferase involved in cell wall biosynthesis
MKNDLLFSIVIPTGGRTKTLLYTLNTVLSQLEKNMEVIVSDNDETDQTANVMKGIHDPRVRLIKTTTRLSMTDHWNFALSATKGEYVLVLGDDDGLLGDSIERARQAIEREHYDIDIVFADLDFYQWPVNGQPGCLTEVSVPKVDAIVDLSTNARHILRWGGARWERLPSVYRAFVRRQVLIRLREVNGKHCDTLNPDMYSGFAIAGIEGLRALRLAYPLAICAMSYARGGKPIPRIVHSKEDRLLSHHVHEYGDVPLQASLPDILPRIFNAFAETVILATLRFPSGYRGVKLNYSAHCAWMASWSGCGTARDFWTVRQHLKAHGFEFHHFLFWYSMYKMRHAFSLRRSGHIQTASKRMTLENVFDAASYLTDIRQRK